MIHGGLSATYVLDEMQMYEVKPLLDELSTKNRDIYEAMRLLAWFYFRCNSKKEVSPTELMPFGWDEAKEKKNTSISNADVERLTKKIKEYGRTDSNN